MPFNSSDFTVARFLQYKTAINVLGRDFHPNDYQIQQLNDVFSHYTMTMNLVNLLATFVKYNLTDFIDRYESIKKLSSNNIVAFELRYGIPEGRKRFQDMLSKQKKTNIIRYGSENPFGSDIIKNKIQETHMKKRGVKHHFFLEEYQEKARATNIERYATPFPNQNKNIRKKSQETCQNRFGASHPWRNPEIRKKSEATWQRKSSTQLHISADHLSILGDKESLRAELVDSDKFQIASKFGVSSSTVGKYIKKHGLDIPKSSFEVSITEFLKQHNVDVVCNSRKIIAPLEIDLFLPEFNIAIEFNGVYWHSSKFKNRKYHRNKYLKCKELGIQLIMINEDEWLFHNNSVKNYLLGAIGMLSHGKISIIKEISQGVSNEFLSENHILAKSSKIMYSVGAYSASGTLEYVMCFSKPTRLGEVEILRFGYNHQPTCAIFGELLQYSIMDKGYSVISVTDDLRYANTSLYKGNNFIVEKERREDYKYVINGVTVSKGFFTKSKILQLYGEEYLNSPVSKIVSDHDIHKIYDCGKIIFKLQEGRS